MNKNIFYLLITATLLFSCYSSKIKKSKVIDSPIIVGTGNFLIYKPDKSKNYFNTTITENITHHIEIVREINLSIEKVRDYKEELINSKNQASKKDKSIYDDEISKANEQLEYLNRKNHQAEEALDLWNQYLRSKIKSEENESTNPSDDENKNRSNNPDYVFVDGERWNTIFSELIGYHLGIYYYESHNPSIRKAKNLKKVLIQKGYPEKKIEFKPRSWNRYQSLNNIYGYGYDVRYCKGEEDAAANQLASKLNEFFQESVELAGVGDCSLTPNSITIVLKIPN